jgi:lipopolysaccharide transport system permease protein
VGVTTEETATLAPPRAARLSPSLFRDLVLHLAKREIDATHRMTLLGWLWPLVRQLAQLAVLVFIFSSVLPLGIDDFPVFVFSGLIAWTWFQTGIAAAATSVLAHRHFVRYPRFPVAVLPVVAVAVPLLDVMLALPVLVVMLMVQRGVSWTIVLLPLPVLMQFVLMSGIAWIVAAASVLFRDIPNLIGVMLTILFYLTPVFYGLKTVPDRFVPLLNANPMTTIVELDRALLLGERAPGPGHIAAVALLAGVVVVGGFRLFRGLEDRLVDEL